MERLWAEQNWTPEERRDLARMLTLLDAAELRDVVAAALETPNAAQVAPALRGALIGALLRVSDRRRTRR